MYLYQLYEVMAYFSISCLVASMVVSLLKEK